MGFYGNITNTSRTQFQFDKIYSNRTIMDKSTSLDGIYIGRFVLVEYDSELSADWCITAYQETKNGNKYFYSAPDVILSYGMVGVETGKYIRIPGAYKDSDGTNIIHNFDDINTKLDIIYLIEGQGEVENTIKVKPILEIEKNPYNENYTIDVNTYGPGRGYDSTVWQKTYVNGKERYVMIAELNTVVPTFDVSADAPTMTPIAPHFDSDSTNVYYKLHWQTPWGLRVKGANPSNYSDDKKQYPTDEDTIWVKEIYDPATKETKRYYYNENTKQWEINKTGISAAIYYNKAGFNPEIINYSDNNIEDSIQIESTGLSGNEYNVHGSIGKEPQIDTQELSILLPSIGNSVAQMWDIIYGNENINGSKNRNMSIKWHDGTETTEPTGLRLININEDGYSYNEQQINTLAGAINSVHDLMGMIIQKKENIVEEDIDSLDPNYIYYLVNDKKFYRKAIEFIYTQFDGEINDNKLYVISDTNNHFIIGSEWNSNIKQRPEGVILGTREEKWQLKELKGFARNYNTIHGLILRLNELLDKEDTNNLLVQNLLNKFNSLVPNAFIGTDNFGQLTNIELTGNEWINIVEGNKINHIQKEINPEVESKEENLEFGDSFTLTSLEIGYDEAGHIDTYKTNEIKYTLPSADYSHENFINLENSVKGIETDVNGLTTSVNSLEETLASYGDIESSIEAINEIKNINYSFDLDSNEKIKSISQNAGKVSVEIETITPDSIGAAPSSHDQSASTITSGTLSSDRLPIIPITKGGTGASQAEEARANLGITLANLGLTASATELNYMGGVTNSVQIQLQDKYSVSTSRTANTVLAAPNGSNGGATFRELVAADLPIAPITKGGTGASDAVTARSNLDITPANIGAQPALGYTPARIDLVNSGGTVNNGGQFSIGTIGYNAKILHTAIDEAPAIMHINQNEKTGTIFASKYLASTDDMIFYTIGLNSITEDGMVTVSAIRIIQIDHTGINSISNTQFGLGAVYAIS